MVVKTVEQILAEAEGISGNPRGASVFTDILAKGIRAGEVPARTKGAREWYRNAAQSISRTGSAASGVSGEAFITSASRDRERSKAATRFMVGNMYTFAYDAKHKETLPYYDMFPLIFPINKAKGGFLGINFHYLPPMMRAQLMDALYGAVNNKKYDETTRLTVSYNILNTASKYRFFKPAVKHYLTKQIRSKLVYINPSEWDIALFLPLARFAGATKQKVYADTRKAIRG